MAWRGTWNSGEGRVGARARTVATGAGGGWAGGPGHMAHHPQKLNVPAMASSSQACSVLAAVAVVLTSTSGFWPASSSHSLMSPAAVKALITSSSIVRAHLFLRGREPRAWPAHRKRRGAWTEQVRAKRRAEASGSFPHRQQCGAADWPAQLCAQSCSPLVPLVPGAAIGQQDRKLPAASAACGRVRDRGGTGRRVASRPLGSTAATAAGRRRALLLLSGFGGGSLYGGSGSPSGSRRGDGRRRSRSRSRGGG